MARELKIKLILYGIISAITFSYLIMPENAGISVMIFSLIQLVCLFFTVPNRKKLIMFAPILIISINSFISANRMWGYSNFALSIVLYGCLFTDFDIKNIGMGFLADILIRIFEPLWHFNILFKWGAEFNSEKTQTIKKVLIALIISLPCCIVLIALLSSADMIFSLKIENLFMDISNVFSFNSLCKILCGCIAGLYLFSALYNSYTEKYKFESGEYASGADLLIINIILSMVLFIYTAFIIIQLKYLFAGSALPDGLSYTEYARKGFFELLALSGINIAAIVTVVLLTHKKSGKGAFFTRLLCCYLCFVSIILLISSFYRMVLYTDSDGLTRLRLMVMGFLVFEAVGLLITFAYIIKPVFNITIIYAIIAICYYCILNVVPIDNIIAKNQIDIYQKGEREGLDYIFTLSADCAPPMEYLYNNTDDEELKERIKNFLSWETKSDIPKRWQRYNLSVSRAENVLDNLK